MESIKISEDWRKKQCPKGRQHRGSNSRQELLGCRSLSCADSKTLSCPKLMPDYSQAAILIVAMQLLQYACYTFISSCSWGLKPIQYPQEIWHIFQKPEDSNIYNTAQRGDKMQLLHFHWKIKMDLHRDTEHLSCPHPNKGPPRKYFPKHKSHLHCFTGTDTQGHSPSKILLSLLSVSVDPQIRDSLKLSLFIALHPGTSTKACCILQTAVNQSFVPYSPKFSVTAWWFNRHPPEFWNKACHISDAHSPRSSQPATTGEEEMGKSS